MSDDVKTETRIFIIRESNLESIIQDGVTFLMLVAVCLISRLMDSQAIGWVGAIMLFIFMISKGVQRHKKHTFSVAEARAELDRIEAKIAKES